VVEMNFWATWDEWELEIKMKELSAAQRKKLYFECRNY
jgi:hypothetical protein